MPLRLLSRPSTATRSGIGVVPGGSSLADGRTGSAWGCAWFAASLVADPPHPVSARAPAVTTLRRRGRRICTQSGVQAW
jgi:hypothetical protein